MAKRGLLDVACPAAKRVVVDGVRGGSSRTAENRTVAQELLRGVLAGLLVHKTAADFPLKCVATVLREVAPLLDGPYNSNDTLLLRAETGAGRNLGLVLLLAAATVAGGGLDALKAERAKFDDSRTARTRNWIGWAKRVRRTSPLLAGLSTGHWSTVRAAIFTEPGDPSDDVVRCFQDHEDAVSIATLDDDYLTCDCCDIASTKCRLQFYRCQKCSMELCAECEERRVNFK
jgi:hypothetical protein